MEPEALVKLKLAIGRAEAAYEDLMLGKAVRSFTDQNGERVEYGATNKGQLYAYIQSLRAQLPDATVQSYTPPIRFLF
jgi:hypothetical protein